MRAKTIRTFLGAAAVATALFAASSAAALERLVYTNDSIAELRASNQPYVIFVHAVWCTTCRAQDRVLELLANDPRFADLRVVVVDYDNQKSVMRAYSIPERSTFVAFIGSSEIGRSAAETNFERLRAFLLSVLQ